jgi:hypothetical protein
MSFCGGANLRYFRKNRINVNMSKYIYEYITREEYECPCCNSLPVDLNPADPMYAYYEFFEGFKSVRAELGKPIKWNSGYRCPDYNYALGGSPLSAHMWGLGGDWECETTEDVDILSAIMEILIPEFRRKEYRKIGTWIHADVAYLIRPRVTSSWLKGWRDND